MWRFEKAHRRQKLTLSNDINIIIITVSPSKGGIVLTKTSTSLVVNWFSLLILEELKLMIWLAYHFWLEFKETKKKESNLNW